MKYPQETIQADSDQDDSNRFILTRHIYQTLTSIYASVFKTTSPLTLDWRTMEVSEMLGRDTELIRLFCDIKTEMFWFCKSIRLASREVLASNID
jgi:hypothetical protein